MTLTASPHLRGIVIAGALAAVAVALGFVTLAMNQSSSSAATHPVLSLKARHLESAHTTTPAVTPKTKPKAKPVKRVPVNRNFLAALHAGLPRSIALALALRPVAVVSLSSAQDSVAKMAAFEALAGAQLARASFVVVNVDRDGGDASALTLLLGQLPPAPATLVYIRPGTLFVSMPGFNDRTTVQQAAANAAHAPSGTTSASVAPASTAPASSAPAATPTAPTTTTPA